MGQTRTVGVLLVHGVGNQKRGEGLNAFMATLRGAMGNLEFSGSDPAVVTARGTTIRIYEAYWADILEGRKTTGSFSEKAPMIAGWFPWLNLVRGAYDRRLYPAWLALFWTIPLLAAGAGFILLYLGGRFFVGLASGDRTTPSAAEQLARLKKIGRESSRAAERTKLDDILDEFAGDVLNYVYSLAGAMPAGSPLAGCAGEIIHRFDEKLDGARLDGCDEIQIVSHSLGTVIAYHALARRAWDAEPMRRITRIYTLGSPLEKIGFFWPRLIPRDGAGHPLLQWHNICDRLDGVAGKLKRFNHWTPVQNHRVWGLGGAARAHIMYQRSPVFQDLVTEGLFGAPSHGKISRWWELFKASVETLIMPVALVIGAVVGLGFVVLVAALFPYLAGWLLRLIGLGQWEPAVRSWGTWGIAGVIVLSSLVATLSEASDLHRRVLAGGQTANEEMPR